MKRIIWSRFFRHLVPMLRVGTSRRTTGTRTARKQSTRALVRPRLECLEDRTLPSQLPSFTVTAPGDAGVGTTTPTAVSGDIRYVINQVDNNPNYAGAVIQFNLQAIGGNIIALTHGELKISNNMDIEGPGANSLTISGDANGALPIAGTAASRVFNISSPQAVVTIAGLTISGGNGSPVASVTPGNQGGDIFNGGDLTLNNDVIENGYVLGSVSGGLSARGGGIFNAEGQNIATGAKLTLSSIIIENNEAQGGAGADSVYISTSGGDGGFGAGGGVYNDTNATVNINTAVGNVQIINNIAQGGKGGKGLFGLNGLNNSNGTGESGGYGGSGGSGGAAMGGGLFSNTGGNLSITGTSTSSILIADNLAQGGVGGDGDFGANGGDGGKLGAGGKGGNGGDGGNGGSTLGGGLYSSGSILSLTYTQFAGDQALGGTAGAAAHGGNGGNGGSKGAGGLGGGGGAGGSGGSAGGGAIYSSGGTVSLKIQNSQFTTDSAGLGNQAIGGAGNSGSTAGNGGNGGGTKISSTQFPPGGGGGAGGAGGGGGNALGGAVLNAGGDVSFTTVTVTTTLAQAGSAGAAGTGGNGGVGGVHTVGGAAGVGGAGGVGGAAQGGGVYNNGGSLTFTNFTNSNSQAKAGDGNAGGGGGVGGVGGKGGGGNSSSGFFTAYGASGAVGGVGGVGGAGGAAQGGGFYNSGGALTISKGQFTNDSVSSGSGSTGGDGGNGGVGGVSGKKFFVSGVGGIGGAGVIGGDAGYAEGGGGANAGGDVAITGSAFTGDQVQAGNGGTGGTGGQGGEGGDANAGNPGSAGAGAIGGNGGNGGSGSTAQGGGLSVTSGSLTISTTTFGGSAGPDQVLGGNGGGGGGGGVMNHFGSPATGSWRIFPPQTPNGGNGGTGGAGTNVTGGGLAVSKGTPPSNLNVLNSFAGIDFNNSGFATPPDTQGAAGPSSYIETVNQFIAIYNKNSTGAGTPNAADSLFDFFFDQGGLPGITPTNPGDFEQQSDPFVIYDPLVQRFIIGDLDFEVSNFGGPVDNAGNALLLAVSKSDNPTTLTSSDWYFSQVNTTEAGVALQDYPGNPGYNADALVVTQNSFGAGGALLHTLINSISISALTNGSALVTTGTGQNVFQTDYNGSSLRPVTMSDAAPGDPMWFVQAADEGGLNIPPSGANTINLLKMTNVLSTTPTIASYSLNVNPYYQATPPKQPDGSIITRLTDSRILNANEANNLIVAAQQVSNATFDEDNARWYEVDVSSGTPTLVQEGDVSGGPGVYEMYPGIAINSAGNIGMSYIQSGTSSGQFMSVYVTGRTSGDPLGTMETPILIHAGTSNTRFTGFSSLAREGDMSGINVDPSDGSFWIANEFANAQLLNWGTAIAHFTVQAAPPPPRTVAISDSSFDDNVITAGNGNIGGKGGMLPNLNYPPSQYTRPVGGLCGDGGAGGNGQGGGIFLSAASAAIVRTATLSGVDASGNSATGGVGGEGGIQVHSNSGAGGVGGFVEGGGVASLNYQLTVNSSSASASTFKGNTGVAGMGGAGGASSLTVPNTSYGGDGGAGGSVLGGGLAFENDTAIALALSITGASATNNQMTAASGGAGGGAGTWDHDHILGGSGGAGGQALGGGLYVFASTSAVNTANINSDTLDGNILTAANGADAGAGASATVGSAAGAFAAGGNGGDALGGGLYNNSLNSITPGTLSIGYSTMAGNQLTGGTGGLGGTGTTSNGGPGGNGGDGGNAEGGGFFNDNTSTLTVINSTVGGLSLSPQSATANSNTLTAGSGSSGGNAGTPQGVSAADGGNGGNGGNAEGGGVFVNIGTLPAAFAPTLVANNSGGSWTAQTAWVLITYVNNFGETIGSELSSAVVAANGTLTIDSPTAEGSGPGAATGWYAYVGVGATPPANTALYRQQAAGSPTPIGANLILTANPTTTGVNPPASNTAFAGTATFINDTIINNQAMNTGFGGAPGSGARSSGTITGGKAGAPGTAGVGEGGGYFADGGGTNSVGNTILDLNAAATNYVVSGNSHSTADVFGSAFTDLGNNILGILAADAAVFGFTASGDQFNVSAAQLNMGPLLNNGGLTPTDALLNNAGGTSVAIDAGNNALIGSYASLFGVTSGTVSNATDQRGPGFPRIDTVNNSVDIGAVELTLPSITNLSASTTVEGSRNVILTITGTGFQSGATVSFGGQTLTPTNISGAQITVTVPGPLPDDSVNDTNPVMVSMGNPDGSGIQGETLNSNAMQFVITEAPFSLQSVSKQTNDVNDQVSLTIAPAPPDSLPPTGGVGNFSATGLPDGLSINAVTGVISGTIQPDAAPDGSSQTYNVTVTAYDDGTSGLKAQVSFQWVVSPFSLAQPPRQTNNEGDTITPLQITSSTGAVTTNYTATGLPTGLIIDPTTGIISGTIDAYAVPENAGASFNFQVTVTAGPIGTAADTTFIWTVNDTTPPTFINPPGDQANNIGDSVNLTIHAQDADSFSATGLPTGLSIDSTTGAITGTITGSSSNIYNVTITATDNGHNSSMSFTWNVTIPFGLLNPGSQSNDEGDQSVSLQISPVLGYTANSYSATGLPTGLSINPSTGLISGNIDPRGAGAYNVTVTATDGQGQQVSVSFNWAVYDTTPPVVHNPGLQVSTAGQTINHFAILADDADAGYWTATGLPKGLSIDTNGVISGTISLLAAGNYTVTIQAGDSYTDANGKLQVVKSSPMSFVWSVNPAPTSSPSSPPGSTPTSPPGVPPGIAGLTTNLSIISVQNQYPGLIQLETVTAAVTNVNGFTVNEGVVTFQVNGQTITAPVVNGVVSVTFSTGLLDFNELNEYLFSHSLTASYSDGAGIFAQSGSGLSVPAIWIDFFMSLLASQLQQLTQYQTP